MSMRTFVFSNINYLIIKFLSPARCCPGPGDPGPPCYATERAQPKELGLNHCHSVGSDYLEMS